MEEEVICIIVLRKRNTFDLLKNKLVIQCLENRHEYSIRKRKKKEVKDEVHCMVKRYIFWPHEVCYTSESKLKSYGASKTDVNRRLEKRKTQVNHGII